MLKNNWFQKSVVYQIYPKSFQDSNGDGIGDIGGITKRLPYLKWLGINAIWICPFYASPMKDNGYDISDYYSIDPQLGTMEDMDNLIRKATELHIDIIIDMVLNHTSDQHQWFLEAVNNPESSYCDYYIIKDRIEGLADLRSNFGGSCWTQLPDGRWYFHTFAKEQPDLNWDNKKLREEIYKMMNWWIDKGIHGFRMDAITYIKKDLRFPPVEADGPDGRCDVGKICLNNHGIMDYLKEMRDRTYGPKHLLVVAETPGVPEGDIAKYIGEDGVFSMIFDFSYTDIDVEAGELWLKERDWSIQEMREALFQQQYNSQKSGWSANYLENHDQPRSISKYFPKEKISQYHREMAKALATLFILLRGTPFIYQGEEIGLLNTKFHEIQELTDINSYGQYDRCMEEGYSVKEAMNSINRRSRDHGRYPMQWDDTENFGFSEETPWTMVGNKCPHLTVKNQIQDKESILSYYRRVIELRTKSSCSDLFIYGSFAADDLESENVISYSRIYRDRRVHVTVNMEDQEIDLSEFMNKDAEIILDNYVSENFNRSLRAYEAIVWL